MSRSKEQNEGRKDALQEPRRAFLDFRFETLILFGGTQMKTEKIIKRSKGALLVLFSIVLFAGGYWCGHAGIGDPRPQVDGTQNDARATTKNTIPSQDDAKATTQILSPLNFDAETALKNMTPSNPEVRYPEAAGIAIKAALERDDFYTYVLNERRCEVEIHPTDDNEWIVTLRPLPYQPMLEAKYIIDSKGKATVLLGH